MIYLVDRCTALRDTQGVDLEQLEQDLVVQAHLDEESEDEEGTGSSM